MEFTIKRNAPTHKLNKHWQYCIGSGHAPLALRADYLKQLKRVHDELGIKRVRFHGIFNDDMQVYMKFSDLMPLPGADKLKQISFRKIGMVYDNILACGMKPYVELSFMPRHLAATEAKCGFYYGGSIAPPRDEKEWTDFITLFVKYLLDRYGEKEVESWPFEIWNEPDVFVFWAGTKEQYYRLYEITAKAIKAVDSRIQVGGPAASGSKWIRSFMKYCKEHQAPVDFISSHQYAGDPIGGVNASADLESETNVPADLESETNVPADPESGINASADLEAEENAEAAGIGMGTYTNLFDGLEGGNLLDGLRRLMPDKSEIVEIPNTGFRHNAAIVKEQAAGLPVYYSEWNENAIFSSYTNDTRKVASYLIKVALDTEHLIDGSSVWCFSDIFEEFSEFPQEFHGGFGLLTHSGIPKPQYYAMKLLADLCENRIELGDGATDGEIGIAAFAGEDRIQVLLFRQKMKNLDLPEAKVQLHIESDMVPESIYLERIDEAHCNPLKLWEVWGYPEELSFKQREDMLAMTKMQKEPVTYTYENGHISVQAELGVNDIYLITVCRCSFL